MLSQLTSSLRQWGRIRAWRQGGADTAIVAGIGVVLTILAAVLVVVPPPLIRFLDYRVYDTLLNAAVFPAPSQVPVLIGIDDASLQQYGQWPWPRYRLAQLVERLDQAGARVIALDLLMPEADRTSPEILFQERRRDLGLAASPAELQNGFPGNDQRLAAVLGRTPVVLGYKFDFSASGNGLDENAPAPLKNAFVQSVNDTSLEWPRPTGALTSLKLLANAAPAAGFTNAGADADGILRRVPLLVRDAQGALYPSLALAALLRATPSPEVRLVLKPEAATLHWQGREIPLDGQGNLLLAFRGLAQQSDRYYSVAEVLTGKLPANSLQGRVAIVGAWAAGLGDRHVTPVDRTFPGIAVHAVVIDTLLTGKFLQAPPWARGAELFTVLCVGLLATFLLSRYGFLSDLLLLLVGTILIVGSSYGLFMAQGLYLTPVMPLLLLLTSCGLLSLVKYGLEVRKVYLRTRELAVAQDATILGMTFLAASRDKETGTHILRTQRYVKALARELRRLDKYRAELTEDNIELLFKSAPLHDIGKVGIPDVILRKPGDLSEEEYRLMKSHAQIGAEALAGTLEVLHQPGGLRYLDYACQVTISHHEKWDGSGYPHGLQGEAIPLAGRLMAVADVYDALISERVYKSGYSHEQAREMIVARRGTHFDPDVVDAFLRCEAEFQRIASDYSSGLPSA